MKLSPRYAFPSGFRSMNIAELHHDSKIIPHPEIAQVDTKELGSLRRALTHYEKLDRVNRKKFGIKKVTDILKTIKIRN